MSFLLALLLLGEASAQTPWEPWRSVQTEHFRIHYPLSAETWALGVASRVESIHERVVADVGPADGFKVDIVVMDPYADANGFAIPHLGYPRMGLFPTAPGAESGIGTYRSWTEELVLHEDVHLVHLLRESRNPWIRWSTRLLGFSPMILSSPRWVIEGYATLYEGKLTGSGRPHSSFRADFVRVLARDGQLPEYAELDGTTRWLGGSYPYLIGSSYLEWLSDRHGADSLDHLQARSTARQPRGLNTAFTGVYGEAPEILYERFQAEVSAQAITVDRLRPTLETTLWADLSRGTGEPAVSPDGLFVAVVESRKLLAPRIVVWPTTNDGQAARVWQEGVERTLAKDPLDVAPKPPKVFEPERKGRRSHGGRAPEALRWMPGSHTLLYTSWTRNANGDWRPDLFTWDTDTGKERQITRHANLRHADPHPDGTRAVAIRSEWGQSELVSVDLTSGKVEPLTQETEPPGVQTVFDRPRWSPDGGRVAVLRHRGDWEIVVYNLHDKSAQAVPLPAGASPMPPTWHPGGSALIASLGINGFIEAWLLPLDGQPPRALTRTAGGAFAPTPTPDGQELFFLGMDPGGLDLRRARLSAELLPPEPELDLSPPVVPRPAGEPIPALEVRPVDSPEPYGFGRPEPKLLIGAAQSPGMGSIDPALRLGDIIGRWEALAIASVGTERAPSGGAGLFTWRGLPVETTLHGWGSKAADTPIQTGLSLETGMRRTPDWNLYAWNLGFHGEAPWGSQAMQALGGAGWIEGAIAHRHWMGEAWIDLGGSGHADLQMDTGARIALGEATLATGWSLLGISLTGAAGIAEGTNLSLGGRPSPFLPAATEHQKIFLPAVLPDTAQGTRYTGLEAELGILGAMSLFGARHDLEEAGATSLVGLKLTQGIGAEPLVRVPNAVFDLGAACVIETADEGWRDDPCKDPSHWGLWLGLGWGPGAARLVRSSSERAGVRSDRAPSVKASSAP